MISSNATASASFAASKFRDRVRLLCWQSPVGLARRGDFLGRWRTPVNAVRSDRRYLIALRPTERRAWQRPRLGDHATLDLLYELEVQVEQPAEELRDEQEVAVPVRERVGTGLHGVELSRELGDVVSERAEALARGLVPHQVGDQETEKRLALERSEAEGCPRVLA